MNDLISRQAAIDAMCLACGHDCDKSKFVYNAPQDEQVIMCPEHYALSTMPSAQPEQRWIPCSEKLPEDGQNVLVTYKTTNKIHPCQYHDDGSRNPWYSYIDQCRAHMNVVTAWMPLPKPYMGTQSDISDRRKD